MKYHSMFSAELNPGPDTDSKRKATRIKALGLILVVGMAVVAASVMPPVHATPQSGVSSVTLAQGVFDEMDLAAKWDLDPGPATDYWKAKINTKGLTRVFVVQNTVTPGGSFGWHSHPGPTLVFVVSGTATEYHGDDSTCTPLVHPAGSTFIDEGESLGHLVRNDGNVNLVVIAVRLFPEGVATRNDLPNPGYCPTLN